MDVARCRSYQGGGEAECVGSEGTKTQGGRCHRHADANGRRGVKRTGEAALEEDPVGNGAPATWASVLDLRYKRKA
jgi:hypothetical protein